MTMFSNVNELCKTHCGHAQKLIYWTGHEKMRYGGI